MITLYLFSLLLIFFSIFLILNWDSFCHCQSTGGSAVCYEEVGCFSQESPWVTLSRPFPPPASPQHINVTVYLMTRNTINVENINYLRVRENPLHVNPASLQNLYFNSNRPRTVFIIHGFAASIRSPWMTEMAQAYLSRIDANVFLVDWGNGASQANYLQVAANTRVVGVIVTRFLSYLINYMGLQTIKVHMIGHSLGAHACGYVGKSTSGILRITGLDVAQPGFEFSDSQVRLDINDSIYLDALHTNAKPTIPSFGLGFMEALGHVDFYFNGGFHQPGCLTDPLTPALTSVNIPNPSDILYWPVEMIADYLSCSHSRSIDYFIEAISPTSCIMWGHQRNIINRALNVITLGRIQRVIDRVSPCYIDTCSPVGLETFLYPARGSFTVTTEFHPEYCIEEASNTRRMKQYLNEYNRYRRGS